MSAALRCDGCGRYADAASLGLRVTRFAAPAGWLVVEWAVASGKAEPSFEGGLSDRGEFCSAHCASRALAELDLAKLVSDG